MTKMSTIYSRLSYGTGTALTGCGVSAKAYADVSKTEVWILADKVAGMSLSDWAIVVGIACTVITCGVNWYYPVTSGRRCFTSSSTTLWPILRRRRNEPC